MPDAGARPTAHVTVTVDLGPRSYDILIGRGLFERSGMEIASRMPGVRAAVVTDEMVERFHLPVLTASLNAAGIDHTVIAVPVGEESKSFPTLATVVDGILAARIERKDIVIAAGGGVVGDLAGFAAAIVRRGMRVVQIPTTLLAQVDSSVGGKTGINTKRGKNLVGAFHQPSLVLADAGVLDTLTPRIFNAGYAEIAKFGLIGDAAFFAWLEANWRAIVAGWPEREHAIAIACRGKAATVVADEREEGVRALLNLGHTFGHALEAATGYSDRLLHGEAVAIGCCLAFRFSARNGLSSPADAERVAKHFTEVGLPTRLNDIPSNAFSPDTLLEHIGQDKKVSGGRLTFILVRGIGQAFIAKDVPPAEVHAFLSEELKAP
ncbi:3-dehydroquinate synthase [soil metagenome]